MAEPFSAESRLIHAGTERAPGRPGTPPFVPASIYVSQGAPEPGRALAIARHLADHPRVAAVHYPGLDRQTADVARRQMPGGSGPLLSFEVTPDQAGAADKVVASSRLIVPATSFGGVESTRERRARWPAETAPAGLIRLSVGVEPAADLITDIDQALEVL